MEGAKKAGRLTLQPRIIKIFSQSRGGAGASSYENKSRIRVKLSWVT